jgi:hypothetical protein
MTAPALLVALATAGVVVSASSHREAPGITKSPKVDGTDFYMFRSYEAGREGFVTLLANYIPLQDVYGGPNFFTLDENAIYEIHVDNDADSIEDVTFQFKATNTRKDLTVPVGGKDIAVPLVNIGPIGPDRNATDNLNVLETYTLNVIRGPRRTGSVSAVTISGGTDTTFQKPADRIGNKSIANNDASIYDQYANNHIYNVTIPGCSAAGARVFVGQRREGFVVSLADIFDLVNLNPLGPADGLRNSLAGKSVTTFALEVPISCLALDGKPIIGAWTTASLATGTGGTPGGGGGNPGNPNVGPCPAGTPSSPKPAANFVPNMTCDGWVPPDHPLARQAAVTSEVSSLAVESSTMSVTAGAFDPCPAGTPASPSPGPSFVPTQNCDGWVPADHPLARKDTSGTPGGGGGGGTTTYTQVSRLGHPLVNEVVIGLKDKDKFNSSEPKNDTQFLDYVTNPTLPFLIQALFGVQAPPTPRNDLVAVFLTGVAGLTQPANGVPSEMLRLNTSIAPVAPADQKPLGVLAGDTAGFPNGRRPGDDVVDIELRAAEGILLASDPSTFPAVTDGAYISAITGYKPDGTIDNSMPLFRASFPYLVAPLSGSPSTAYYGAP